MKNILLASFLVLLTACAAQQRETNDLANLLYQQPPNVILQKLQATQPPERDYAQFHLNQGLLQLLSGQFPLAIESLTLAKKEMQALSALSISETAAAGTVNETLRSYSGYPTDRVMVHTMLALSYLFDGDIGGARVEVLQADIAMKKLAEKDTLNGQLASAHLLAGIIYELLDEQSNALISYKYSESLLKQRELSIPSALQQALLRMSYQVDRNGQYVTYQKRYSGYPTPKSNTASQVFTLYFDGIVSNKQALSIMVPSGNNEQLIRISMPAYNKKYRHISRAKLKDASHQVITGLIDNLEVSVREDLAQEYPSILLLTTTRALAKYELVSQVNQQDSFLGALANLVTVLSEVADLRSWNMLPANIQFAYIESADDSVTIEHNNAIEQQIMVTQGSRHLVLVSSLETPVFHYQQ